MVRLQILTKNGPIVNSSQVAKVIKASREAKAKNHTMNDGDDTAESNSRAAFEQNTEKEPSNKLFCNGKVGDNVQNVKEINDKDKSDSIARSQANGHNIETVRNRSQSTHHLAYKNYADYPLVKRDFGRVTFPRKLHDLLNQPNHLIDRRVISWAPHGRSFYISDVDRFVEHVLPRAFNQSTFSSFRRQLNLYGFTLLTKRGSSKCIVYYHEMFLQGRPDLCYLIKRKKNDFSRFQGPNTDEPNFFAMPHCLINNGELSKEDQSDENKKAYSQGNKNEASENQEMFPKTSIHDTDIGKYSLSDGECNDFNPFQRARMNSGPIHLQEFSHLLTRTNNLISTRVPISSLPPSSQYLTNQDIAHPILNIGSSPLSQILPYPLHQQRELAYFAQNFVQNSGLNLPRANNPTYLSSHPSVNSGMTPEVDGIFHAKRNKS